MDKRITADQKPSGQQDRLAEHFFKSYPFGESTDADNLLRNTP